MLGLQRCRWRRSRDKRPLRWRAVRLGAHRRERSEPGRSALHRRLLQLRDADGRHGPLLGRQHRRFPGRRDDGRPHEPCSRRRQSWRRRAYGGPLSRLQCADGWRGPMLGPGAKRPGRQRRPGRLDDADRGRRAGRPARSGCPASLHARRRSGRQPVVRHLREPDRDRHGRPGGAPRGRPRVDARGRDDGRLPPWVR